MNTWKLYKNSKITIDKNFKVDSIEQYLSTLSYETITGVSAKLAPQYIKHSLNLVVKISKNQSVLNFFDSVNNYNYMSIQNDSDGYPIYYFINKRVWVSENTIALYLTLDTVNSFTTERGSFTISDRTLVLREHKNRIKVNMWEGFHTYDFDVKNLPLNIELALCNEDDVTSGVGIHSELIVTENDAITINIRNRATGEIVSTLQGHNIYIDDIGDGTNNEIEIEVQDYNGVLQGVLDNCEQYLLPNSPQILTINLQANTYVLNGNMGLENILRAYYIPNGEFIREIDPYSEGIDAVTYKVNEQQLDSELNLDWYLVYMNENEPDESAKNPVQVQLCASEELTVRSPEDAQTINFSDLTPASFNLFNYGSFKLPNGDVYSASTNISGTGGKSVIIEVTSTGMYISEYSWSTHPNDWWFWDVGVLHKVRKSSLVNSVEVLNKQSLFYQEFDHIPSKFNSEGISKTIEYNSIQTVILKPLSSLDRTDSRIIKIIKLPYCPIEHNFNSDGTLNVNLANWTLSGEEFLLLQNQDEAFENKMSFGYVHPFEEKKLDMYLGAGGYDTESPKDIRLESKLLHSDYFYSKFVYDSFAFTFKLECLDDDSIRNPYYKQFNLTFNATSTINSKFMFTFPQYSLESGATNFIANDYQNVLPIARNNEMVIYNNSYINYIRAGYNYDIKNKNRSNAMNWLGAGLNLVGAVASFASTPWTGGVGVVSGIALATSTTGTIANAVNSTVQTEQNLAQKQLQLQMQSESVSGSDDVDLMSKYSANKAKLTYYEVSPKMRRILFNLFYYTGYISNTMKIPDLNTRLWFNFISCELQMENITNIPDDCIADILDRYKNGVTVMHRHANKYNWERTFENWEINLPIPEHS